MPFLTWHRTYAPHVGRVPVPTLAQLSWPAAEALAYVLLTGGIAGLAGAVAAGSAAWIRAAGVLLTLGALAFGLALVYVLSHRAPDVAGRVAAASVQPPR